LSADPKPDGKPTTGATPDDDLRRRIETARAGGEQKYHAKLREQASSSFETVSNGSWIPAGPSKTDCWPGTSMAISPLTAS